MSEHECIIGELYDYDDTRLVTVNELLEDIRIQHKTYDYALSLNMKTKLPYTLKDYVDRRKSTDLTRFKFCPYCGKKIDWKKIKEENEDEERI